MAKERSATHLSEDASEAIVRRHLPDEWVLRRFHPDYGVDLSVEVFERMASTTPIMGDSRDTGKGEFAYELDVIKYSLDVDTIDNARLMGPSTPLLLYVVHMMDAEVYYICLTDYCEKVLEPRSSDLFKKNADRTVADRKPQQSVDKWGS